MGITEEPKKFAKALKPLLSEIRLQNITVAEYVNDLMTLADMRGYTYEIYPKL